MSKKRTEVVIEKKGFKLVFWKENRDEVNVDVYKREIRVLEWTYPILPTARSLQAAADLWVDQAILQVEV